MAESRAGNVGTAALIATIAIASAALVTPAPASAALSYVQSAANTSTAEGNQGANTVNCPPSSYVVGGGAFSTGAFGAVAIIGSLLDGASAWREVTDVYEGTQLHRAFAICDTTAPALRVGSKTVDAGTEKTVRARCLAGEHVYGGGYIVASFGSPASFGVSVPSSSRPYAGSEEGWKATAFVESGPQTLVASALCGPKKTTVRTRTVDVDPTSQGHVQKKCASGDQVTGGGADITVGGGRGWISTTYPVDTDSDNTPNDAWKAYLENTSSKPREITVYAVCR